MSASSPLSIERGFDIGLVLAGAVSAGAYTAGVISFLFEALEEWHERPWTTLTSGQIGTPYPVRLQTVAGASAGGMCAALTAVAALQGSPEVLRRTWVDAIDIEPLLATDDLVSTQRLGQVTSLLNCQVLDRIAANAVQVPAAPRWPAWLGKDGFFDFFLTLTNLNGLTYAVEQTGGSAQRFVDHADRIHFRLRPSANGPEAPVRPELCELLADDASHPGWAVLRQAALATGAFPLALLSRVLEFDNAYFDQRPWYGLAAQGTAAYVKRAAVPPLSVGSKAKYRYVDGGVTNNEPLELARQALFGPGAGPASMLPGARQSQQALLMVDPFPSEDTEGKYEELAAELGPVLARLYVALRNQSRFKVEELLGALNLNQYSRFAISPTRSGGPTGPALTSSVLDAFGGFLHRPFREHDYQLGRRNCQLFLKQWLVLSEHNPLFAYWDPAERARYRVQRTVDGALQPLRKDGDWFLPVLPIRPGGPLDAEIPLPDWHDARLPLAREQEISRWLQQRLHRLATLGGRSLPSGSLKRWAGRQLYLWVARPWLVRSAHTKVMTIIRQELGEAGLG